DSTVEEHRMTRVWIVACEMLHRRHRDAAGGMEMRENGSVDARDQQMRCHAHVRLDVDVAASRIAYCKAQVAFDARDRGCGSTFPHDPRAVAEIVRCARGFWRCRTIEPGVVRVARHG